VTVGRACYLGAGGSVKEGVRIGDDALLGMGSVLLTDMPASAVYGGNPARPLDRTADR